MQQHPFVNTQTIYFCGWVERSHPRTIVAFSAPYRDFSLGSIGRVVLVDPGDPVCSPLDGYHRIPAGADGPDGKILGGDLFSQVRSGLGAAADRYDRSRLLTIHCRIVPCGAASHAKTGNIDPGFVDPVLALGIVNNGLHFSSTGPDLELRGYYNE